MVNIWKRRELVVNNNGKNEGCPPVENPYVHSGYCMGTCAINRSYSNNLEKLKITLLARRWIGN